MLEESPESPLDCKETKPIHFEGNQPRVEGQILKPRLQYFGHLMTRLPGKDPDVGKVWRHEEKGTTEGEMVGQGHRSGQHEF